MLQNDLDRHFLSELMKASAMALTGIAQGLAQGQPEKIPNLVSVARYSLELIGQYFEVHVPDEKECMHIVGEIRDLQDLYGGGRPRSVGIHMHGDGCVRRRRQRRRSHHAVLYGDHPVTTRRSIQRSSRRSPAATIEPTSRPG